jgi:hypothetical protein
MVFAKTMTTAKAASLPSTSTEVRRPMRLYGAALLLLWVLQTAGRLLLFAAADTGTGLLAALLHAGLVVSLLGLLVWLFSWLAAMPGPAMLRGGVAAAVAATVQSILTAFDIYQGIFINLTGNPAPTLIVFNNPMLALSLLDNIGVSPYLLAGIVVALWAAHFLLYLAGWRLLLAVPAWIAAKRFRLVGPVRASGRVLLAVAAIGLFKAVGAVPISLRTGDPLLEGLRPVFQMAPADMLAAARQAKPRPFPRNPPPAASRPLVLIVVDALRRDRMGLYNPQLANTPFLSGLHAQGKLQKFDGYATCTFSFCGIMSIVASRSWNDFGPRPETLIERLTANSYQTHLVMAGQHANFGGLIDLFGGPPTSVTDQASGDKPSDTSTLEVLEGLRVPDPRHSFVYIHFLSTHAGSFIEPPFRVTKNDTGQMGTYLFDPEGKRAYAEIYDRRVQQADDIVRRAFQALERKGMLKDALVIITSDHGQRTSEGGLLYHGGEADPPTISIPIMVYDTRSNAYPARPLASQIDVAPTLLHALGLPPVPGWRGIPLQRPTSRAAVPVGTSESTGVVAQQNGVPVLYLCDRDSGRETLMAFDSRQAKAGPVSAALRRLHGETAAPVREPPCRK